jgi:uncharacterized protein (UPF0333 family)
MRSKSQSGFAHLVLLVLILVVVAAVVLVGVHVMQNQNTGETSSAPVASSSTLHITAPDKITSSSDLNATKAALNYENVDSDLNPNSLNSDIDSLL